MDLKNKNIIITGCSRGIGAATMKKLFSNGANIIACYRKKNDLNDNFRKINKDKLKNTINNYYFNLENFDEIKETAKKILSEHDSIDCIVNVAGINSVSLFMLENISNIKKVFDINFFSQIYFTQFFLKNMVKNKSGSIIFMSSTASTDGIAGRLPYSASKASLDISTKILSKELGPYNIRVNAVAPGIIDTEMAKGQLSEKEIDNLKKKISLRRIGKKEEVADLIEFLCSDNSKYITGQTIRADGGSFF